MTLTMVLQGLHVFFGILWFGGVMFANFVVIPAANRLDAAHANAFYDSFGKIADRVMVPAGTLTILLGILLGWRESAFAQIGQPFGNTYLAATVLGIGVFLWGTLLIGRNIKKANSFGIGTPEFVAIVDKVKKYAALEMLGFFVLFGMMVAMRFGW